MKRILIPILSLSLALGISQSLVCQDPMGPAEKLAEMHWTDHPENPLIYPPKSFPYKIIGDPTVLNPNETPDGMWHMWANTIPGLHHYTSRDGIQWEKDAEDKSMKPFKGGIRCSILKRENAYYLFYEDMHLIAQRNKIAVSHSSDLSKWSEPVVLLAQDLDWERQSWLNKTLQCPGIAYHPAQKKYYLFYSTGMTKLKGSHVKGIREPTHLGIATSSDPLGPYEKMKAPLLEPDPDDQWHNLGAGAMQCYWIDELELLVGFNNGIYSRETAEGRVDGSGILVYTSADGKNWKLRTRKPILLPDDSGRIKWKDALVYQMGLTSYEGTFYLYYNARNKEGVEYIGLATCPEKELLDFLREDN